MPKAAKVSNIRMAPTLADRIKEILAATAMGKAQFARVAKVTDAAVTHWLNGDTISLKGQTAARIEQGTGYRAAWVATGRGPKLVDPSEKDDMLLPREVQMVAALRMLSEEQQATHIERIVEEARQAQEIVDRALKRMGLTSVKTPPKPTD